MQDNALNRLKSQAKKLVEKRVDDLITPMNPPIVMRSKPQDELTKSSIRINSETNIRFKHLCVSERISKDVFIEAALEYLMSNPEELAAVILAATNKSAERREKGNHRRAVAYREKYLSD
jgi:hypothetical protein